jgi:hypothetical protein
VNAELDCSVVALCTPASAAPLPLPDAVLLAEDAVVVTRRVLGLGCCETLGRGTELDASLADPTVAGVAGPGLIGGGVATMLAVIAAPGVEIAVEAMVDVVVWGVPGTRLAAAVLVVGASLERAGISIFDGFCCFA